MLIRDELTVCRWEGAWVGGNWVRLFIFHRYSFKYNYYFNSTPLLKQGIPFLLVRKEEEKKHLVYK